MICEELLSVNSVEDLSNTDERSNTEAMNVVRNVINEEMYVVEVSNVNTYKLSEKSKSTKSIASNKLDIKNNKNILLNQVIHAQDNEFSNMIVKTIQAIDSSFSSLS